MSVTTGISLSENKLVEEIGGHLVGAVKQLLARVDVERRQGGGAGGGVGDQV